MQNDLLENVEELARKLVKAFIRKGVKPNHSFDCSQEVAQKFENEIGHLEYDQVMKFLLENEWLSRLAHENFIITDWGVTQALEMDI